MHNLLQIGIPVSAHHLIGFIDDGVPIGPTSVIEFIAT